MVGPRRAKEFGECLASVAKGLASAPKNSIESLDQFDLATPIITVGSVLQLGLVDLFADVPVGKFPLGAHKRAG